MSLIGRRVVHQGVTKMWRYVLNLAVLFTACSVHAQEVSPWIGKRVFTQYGTVLKVGSAVVDDEGREIQRCQGNSKVSGTVFCQQSWFLACIFHKCKSIPDTLVILTLVSLTRLRFGLVGTVRRPIENLSH